MSRDDAHDSAAGAGLSDVVAAILAELPMSDDGTGHVVDCGYTYDDPTCGCYTLRERIAAHVATRVADAEARVRAEVEAKVRALAEHWMARIPHQSGAFYPEATAYDSGQDAAYEACADDLRAALPDAATPEARPDSDLREGRDA